MDVYQQNREITERDFLKNEQINVSFYDTIEHTYYTYRIEPASNGKLKLTTYKELPNKEGVMEDKKIATKTGNSSSIVSFINNIIKDKTKHEDLTIFFVPKGYHAEYEKSYNKLMDNLKEMGYLKGHKTTVCKKSSHHKNSITQLENSVRKMF